MKKILAIVLIAIFVVVSVVGVTATVSKSAKPITLNNSDIVLTSSEHYEVVEFTAPEKTVYSLSEDVYTIDVGVDKNGNDSFLQQVNFDGTGMSITVKNTRTNKTEKHDYSCEYFDLDGRKMKCENCLSFKFEPEKNTILTQGEYITQVILTTNDGSMVLYNMTFTLVDDTIKQPPTQAPTQEPTTPQNEANNVEKNIAPDNNESDIEYSENEETEDEVVLPQIRSVWYAENNPNGCSICINSQQGNTLNLTVSAVRGKSSQIATSDITVTLDCEYDDSIVRGYGGFEYTDSFGNCGTGSISVSENVIILVINEEYNSGRGWGISHNTGKYL